MLLVHRSYPSGAASCNDKAADEAVDCREARRHAPRRVLLPHVRQHAQEDMLTLERERSSSGKCLGPLGVGRWGALVCEGECVVVRRVGCHVAARSCDVREGPCGGARAERAQRLAVPECA